MALSRELMFGCLGWIIFVSLASTKLQTILHQQPMKIDIFNIDPFEPIGRHSLLLALTFLGGTVISLIFRPLAEGIDIAFVVIYAALIVVIVLIFFLSMRHTHRVLADAKTSELDEVERKIASSFRSLRVSHLKMTEEIPETLDINLWLKYEERLKKKRGLGHTTPPCCERSSCPLSFLPSSRWLSDCYHPFSLTSSICLPGGSSFLVCPSPLKDRLRYYR